MVDNSRSQIPQIKEKNKQHTARNVKKADHARQFQHITVQPVNYILQGVDNTIL